MESKETRPDAEVGQNEAYESLDVYEDTTLSAPAGAHPTRASTDAVSPSLYPGRYQPQSQADPNSNQTSAVSQVSSLYDTRYQPRSEIPDSTQYENTEGR